MSEKGTRFGEEANERKEKVRDTQRASRSSILEQDPTFGVILSNPPHRSPMLQVTCPGVLAQTQSWSQGWNPGLWHTSQDKKARGTVGESLCPALPSGVPAR